MKTKYVFFKDQLSGATTYLDTERFCWIPTDTANTDYQQYLEWLAEGNTPEEWNPDGSV